MFQPKYTVSPQLLRTIKRITILVHELNRQHISGPVEAQLLSEARITSTYASTSIEGNPLPLTEVRRILKNRPEQLRQSEQEVINYNQVLSEYSTDSPKEFTTKLLCQLHQGIMQNLLPVEQIGHWRQEPVVVYDPRTGGIVYLPPDHQDVDTLMEELVEFAQSARNVLDPLLLAGIFHKQFVVIHPFVDGNGRTTRLATNILLADLGLDFANLLSFENYYNQNVTRYFQKVGVFGNYYEIVDGLDFTTWLEYFAEGILDELLRLEKSMVQAAATPNTRLREYHRQILDYIERHGFITDRDYAKLTTRAKATRNVDFNRLLGLGLIERQGRGPSVHYVLKK